AITVPLVILAFFSVVAGWLNGLGFHYFAEWTRNETFVHAAIPEPPFNWGYAGASLVIAGLGLVIGFAYYERHAFGFLHELSGRLQQYAAFLFGALVVLGAALVAFT